MAGLDPRLSGLAASQTSLLPTYDTVIIGLVPMIHDFARSNNESRGWSACADHDGGWSGRDWAWHFF
jgi:hypothetical protein